MRKLIISVFIASFFSIAAYSQTIQKLNLDFEQNEKGSPSKWENFGSNDYKIYTDSAFAKSGKFSAVIENKAEISDYKAISISLPGNYDGKFIRLSGYIKTENITNGYAGLWMRIDPEIAFDNMNKNGVTGTTDWKKYEIVLPLKPNKTEKIVIGGLLIGKGKMWLDNLEVSIDGKDLDDPNIEIYQREIPPAEKDKEFDNGSNITFPDLNNETTTNLELLGKIWGFLKYHHHEIAKGNYNWDYELFRILPAYLKVQNNQERDKILSTWIEKLGTVPVCKNCEQQSNELVIKPDLSWLDRSNLSTNLIASLHKIYENRHQGEQYYIALHEVAGNPDFRNENQYSNMPYPDKGFRLLSLYRYWNMIQYFYPYKHLTNTKWDGILREYIQKFLNAKDELEYEIASLQIIGEINDSHANLWRGDNKISELRGSNFAPFKAEFIENKFVVTDYYNPEFSELSKLKIGDIITHINGKTVEFLVDSLKAFYPSSNEASMNRDLAEDLLRSSNNIINLRYVSDKQDKQHNLTLYDKGKLNRYQFYKVNTDEKCFKILAGNIGYVTLANIKNEDISEIKESLKNTAGIIIDIRNYPSTFVIFDLGSYFVSKPTSFAKFTQGNPNNPGEFAFSKGDMIVNDKNFYKGKLIVLVNEKSQSQAEYTAMAFRAAANCTIIGSTTAGADGNVSRILLPGGMMSMISGIGVYYPDGTETQRKGIIPDIIVKPSIEGIKNGKDEVLEKAISLIKP